MWHSLCWLFSAQSSTIIDLRNLKTCSNLTMLRKICREYQKTECPGSSLYSQCEHETVNEKRLIYTYRRMSSSYQLDQKSMSTISKKGRYPYLPTDQNPKYDWNEPQNILQTPEREKEKEKERAHTHTPASPKFSSSTRQTPPHPAFVDCELHNHQQQLLSPNPPPVSAILDRFLWFQSQSRKANTICASETKNSAINESSTRSQAAAASPNPHQFPRFWSNFSDSKANRERRTRSVRGRGQIWEQSWEKSQSWRKKNKRFVEEACRYDRRCKNSRAFLFGEDIWMWNLFLEFFKKENRDKKRRV